jgi:hypothetical protein
MLSHVAFHHLQAKMTVKRNYTNQYIRFADTKAGFCVAIVLALFGALVSAGTHELFLHVARVQWALLAWASLVAFLLLIVAVLAAVAAVRPRLWTHSSRGFIFWESVAAYESPDRFSDAFRTQLDNDLKDHLAHHLYTLAKVCRRKYLWVNWAIFTGATGGVLGLIVLFFQRSRS